jgi:hypothetical protein
MEDFLFLGLKISKKLQNKAFFLKKLHTKFKENFFSM